MWAVGLYRDERGDQVVARVPAALRGQVDFSEVPQLHHQLFNPANIVTHVLATKGDLGRPHEVIRLAEELMSRETGLPPSRDGAQTSLLTAWDSASVITPQRADGAHEAWACGPVPCAVPRGVTDLVGVRTYPVSCG